ncbi:MAG: hypothetical protein JST54_23125 [Deltaproteobacteria bacterium]|nr:hypothetical protein [Deltaproteobacteria bacterium]
MLLAAVVAFGVMGARSGRNDPAVPSCPTCQTPLVNRGFLGWNGGKAGDLNMVTTGVAAPSEAFIAGLRAAAKAAPIENTRLVGALNLFECSACHAQLLDERGRGLRTCDTEQWRALTRQG